MKILYCGGGTMGSVSPLVAIHQKIVTHYSLRITDYESLWLGTIDGVEKQVIENAGIKFESIESGKLRRYFDLENFLDIFKLIISFFQALYWIIKFEPDIVLTAGSFVAVPVAYAAFFYNVPVFAHQQDVRVGLANKLIAPVTKKITVALEKSLQDFKKEKVVLVGNPVRQFPSRELPVAIPTKIQFPNKFQISNFKFQNNLPVVLVIGGGTGALIINELVFQSLSELTKFCNIIHLTGKNKILENYSSLITRYSPQYKSFEFLSAEQMSEVYQVSDAAVSRAGMSTLTELAYFKKPTIIIPIPDSHQEDNAAYFAEKNAGIYLKQNELSPEKFVLEIKNLLADEEKRKEIGEKMNKIFVDYSGDIFLRTIL